MPKKIFPFLVLFVLWTPLLAISQTSDDLFNGNILQEIRIYIHPDDWTNLKLHYLENTHYAIDFHWMFNGTDIPAYEVAARSRGEGSRSPIKPSLAIEFSRYENRDHFLGLRNLVLRGNTQDASMMHERLAMEFFRRLGIPAPREAHARLFVNDQYQGLYTIVEDVDPQFLRGRFGEDGGYLYRYQHAGTYVFESRGSNPAAYSPSPFKPENHFIDPNPEPIAAMVRAINEAPDSDFQAAVSQYLDINGFIREISAENFLAEQDGILGNFGLSNFFLYRFQNSVLSTFVPWDKSNTFWAIDWPIMHNVDTNVLSTRLLSISELLALYRNYLWLAADAAGDAGGWLEQEIVKEYRQIRQAAYDDPNKLCDPGASGTLRPCSNDEFDAEVAYMIQFARQRAANVRAQLAESP